MELKHFKIYELVDKETFEQYGESCIDFFTPQILIAIDGVWEFFNSLKKCAVTVNNWYWNGELQWRGLRTMEKAKQLCAPLSEHRYEPNVHKVNAVDCNISHFPAATARKIIQENKNHPLLVTITRMESIVTWLHIDCKPLKAGQERVYLFKG